MLIAQSINNAEIIYIDLINSTCINICQTNNYSTFGNENNYCEKCHN